MAKKKQKMFRALKYPLWDTVSIPKGVGYRALQFFDVPLGGVDPLSGKRKSKYHTNLKRRGKIGNDWSSFDLFFATIEIISPNDNDICRLLSNGIFAFGFAGDIWNEYPLPSSTPIIVKDIAQAEKSISGGLTCDEIIKYVAETRLNGEVVSKDEILRRIRYNGMRFDVGGRPIPIKGEDPFSAKISTPEGPIVNSDDMAVRVLLYGVVFRPADSLDKI